MDTTCILTIACPARSGIVAAVSTYVAERQCDINGLSRFDDEGSNRFFRRAGFRFDVSVNGDLQALRNGSEDIAVLFDMQWPLFDKERPMRVLLMVSTSDHCLADLLYRHARGGLEMTITAVVSNHLDPRPMAERDGIRFIHLPVTLDTEARQDAELMRIVEETGTELVGLARYLQILSDNLCKQLSGRTIDIHHSLLPGVKGATSYHQAYQHGVKLIGATAPPTTSPATSTKARSASTASGPHPWPRGPGRHRSRHRDRRPIARPRVPPRTPRVHPSRQDRDLSLTTL